MKISDGRTKLKPNDLYRGDIIRFKVSGAYYMLVKNLVGGGYSLLDLSNGEINNPFVDDLFKLFREYNEIDEVYRDRNIKLVLE